MTRRSRSRGLTLLEVMVSIGILAMVGSLIYGAFDGMSRSRRGLSRINDRYHQGRAALSRMSRELQSGFLSVHQPPSEAARVRKTAFIGTTERVDFTSFSHRRLERDSHESDQNEIGYFISRDPESSSKYDLVRRESKYIDEYPTKGGIIQVLAEDVDSFSLQYFEPVTGEWVDTWDSTQLSGQPDRLPSAVKVTVVLNGGPNDEPLTLRTKIPISIQLALDVAL
jgi:general secretion pathway protein J